MDEKIEKLVDVYISMATATDIIKYFCLVRWHGGSWKILKTIYDLLAAAQPYSLLSNS